MELANVGGVFLVLTLGSLFAVFINFIQFLFYVKKQADDNDLPFRDEFMAEIRFVGKFSEMTKELRHRKPSNSSGQSSVKHSSSAVHTLVLEQTPKRESEKSERN